MPIHDWTRVRANRFHDFHQSWMVTLSNALNAALLPTNFFAMVEQVTGSPEPDVIVSESSGKEIPNLEECGLAVQTHPPRVRIVEQLESARYAEKASQVTIRHPDGEVVAVIEIVSPGNKGSQHALRSFADKAVDFLLQGIHLLIVDLFPPSDRDPQGIHRVIWDQLTSESTFTLPEDKPLTLVSYRARPITTAYIEPVAVGDGLSDMPIFLFPDRYILCPLESTYQAVWNQFPAPLRGPLESREG